MYVTSPRNVSGEFAPSFLLTVPALLRPSFLSSGAVEVGGPSHLVRERRERETQHRKLQKGGKHQNRGVKKPRNSSRRKGRKGNRSRHNHHCHYPYSGHYAASPPRRRTAILRPWKEMLKGNIALSVSGVNRLRRGGRVMAVSELSLGFLEYVRTHIHAHTHAHTPAL